MPKSLIRIVSFLLICCLVPDPGCSIGFDQPSCIGKRHLVGVTFSVEALTGCGIWQMRPFQSSGVKRNRHEASEVEHEWRGEREILFAGQRGRMTLFKLIAADLGDPDLSKKIGSDVLEMPTETLGLSVRSWNSLKNRQITTVGELLKKSEAELLEVKNFGRLSLKEVKEALTQLLREHAASSPEIPLLRDPLMDDFRAEAAKYGFSKFEMIRSPDPNPSELIGVQLTPIAREGEPGSKWRVAKAELVITGHFVDAIRAFHEREKALDPESPQKMYLISSLLRIIHATANHQRTLFDSLESKQLNRDKIKLR